MAEVTHSRLRRGMAAVVLGAALAAGAGMVTGSQHASAQSIPNKTCTGTGTKDMAKSPDLVTCTVFATGVVEDGTAIAVKPTAPTGSVIRQCTGVTNEAGPPVYSTTVTPNADGSCTFTIKTVAAIPVPGVPGPPELGNVKLGTEVISIPSGVPDGTSVAQQAQECPPPLAVPGLPCSPFLPMGTSGPGSCIGGTALPIVGGCTPALPITLPASGTPTPTGVGTTTGNNSASPSGAAQAANSTPFTSGPDHPLPVAAILVAVGGALLVVLGAGPLLLRRRRSR
ncbi:MAG: hypothetical protein JF887_06510 [Candidatus Dormibacteraeota bacterium]|uniref:Gram-positive cocci surface proteins LPxTG domain-containing protein n=1 Tax=Candidatus Amunia macphersoniae TaxID=3127014 RepID=A0A934NES5_9BACT|nr:hypothetical protein [Candidatus Dormibacteraeota bacterium]